MFAVSASAANISWTREMDAVWSTCESWADSLPVTTDLSVYDAGAAEYSMQDLKITTQTGLISIGGANTLTLGASRFSMSNDTMGLAMEAVLAIAAEQARNEDSVRMLAVKDGANVNLSRIGIGDLALGGSNIFVGTKVIEDAPLAVPASLKGTNAGKLAFTEFALMSAGAVPRLSPRLDPVKFRGDSVVAGATNRGGKISVAVSIRGAHNEGAKEKIATSADSTSDFEAAVKLSHGTGPLFFAGDPEHSSQTHELVSANDGPLGNITATNTSIQPIIRIPKSALNLVAGVVPVNQGSDYATYIAGTNPVGWWGMNETSGTTTADLSGAYGAANNLTAGGLFNGTQVYPGGVPDPLGPRNINLKYGPTALINQPGYVRGTSNKATYFAGAANVDPNPTASVAFGHAPGPVTTDNMVAPNNAFPGAIYVYDATTGYTGLSLEIWAKTNGATGQDSERFIGSRHWGFGFTSNFGVMHFTTFGKTDYFGGAMPSDNDWHQFGVTWTAATGAANFYLDGVPWGSSGGQTSMLAINPSSINNAITVGGRPSGGQAFKGWIDEAVVWSFPRTAADFNASYLAAQTPLTTAYWAGTTSGVWNANVKNFAFNIEGTNYAKVPVSSITDVIFNANVAANFTNTTLGVDTTIKSLTFASYSTSSVGIGGGNTLTVTPATDRVGVTVESGSGTHTISTNVALGSAQTWAVTDASQTLNMSGVISGAFSLTKSGTGTLVLAGNNINTGGTTVAQGTLALDYTTVGSKLTDAGVLTFAGGTVDLRNGATTHNEVVASTTISGGLSNVTRSSGTSVLRLNTITPGLGVLNFGADNIADTDNTNTNGILGGWATMGRTDWAANSTNTADGLITAFAGYADINVRGASTIADGVTTNVRLLGDGTSGNITLGAVATTVNTLLQSNSNFAGTVDTAGRALATNGIMIATGRQGLTIGTAADSGILKSATAGGAIFLNNFSASNTLTVNAVIADNTSASGLGTVGAVVLNGTNTYTGATMVDTGVLSVRNSAGLGGTAGGTTVQFGAALELQGGAGLSIGAESLTLSGTGINSAGVLRSISGNNTWAGTVTLAGDVRINTDAGSMTLNAASSITASDRNLILGGAGNGAVTGSISTGAGTLTKDGAGTWTLSGVNTYTCETKLVNGTLSVGANASLGNGGALIFDGGTLKYTGASDTANRGLVINAGKIATFDITQADTNLTVSGATSTTTGALTKSGPGSLTLTGSQSYTGATNVNGGTFSIGGGGTLPALASSGITLANNSNVTFNHSDTATYGKSIAGTGFFTKSGTGTLTLNIAQAYSGDTFISGGTLRLASGVGSQALVHYAFDSVNGTTVPNAGTGGTTLDGVLHNGTISSGKFGNAISFTPTYIDRGFGAYPGDSGVLTQNKVSIGNAFTLSAWVSTTVTPVWYGRIITNDYRSSAFLGLNKDTGPSYSVIVASEHGGGAINTQTVDTSGAWHHVVQTWDGATNTFYYDGVFAGSAPYSANSTLTEKFGFGCDGGVLGYIPYDESWDGKMDEAFVYSRALSAAEVQRLYTNNGDLSDLLPTTTSVNISSGATLDLNSLNQRVVSLAGVSGARITNNGTQDSVLTLSGSATATFSGVISDGTTNKIILVKAGNATQILVGTSTYTGTTTINAGTLQLGDGGTTGATSKDSILVINGTGTFAINRSNSTVQNSDFGLLTGNGTFVQAGNGTTVLSLSNTFTGATVVNAGTLAVNGGSISGSTTTVSSGGTLAGDNGTLGNVTINSGGTLSPGGGVGIGALTVNGDINLNGSSIFSVQFDSTAIAVDGVNLNGNLNIASGSVLNVSDIGSNPSSIFGVTAPVITYSGAWNGGTFAGLPDDSYFMSAGQAYQISYDGGAVTLTMLAVIPEPGAAVSLLGGLGLLLGVRRRRE